VAVDTEPPAARPRGRRSAVLVAVVVVVALLVGGLGAAWWKGRSSSPVDDGPPPRLVWSDDFTSGSLSSAAWDPLHLSTFGDGNQELA
jgi:hypothetical protein